jgi:hypothetical protein
MLIMVYNLFWLENANRSAAFHGSLTAADRLESANFDFTEGA